VAASTLAQPGTAAQTQTKQQQKPPRTVTLHLPKAKAVHLEHYRSLARSKTLFHDVNYDRSNPAQRDVWKQTLRPLSRGSARGTMEPAVYRRARELLSEYGYAKTEDQLDDKALVPNWSREKKPPVATEVDHVVELQLLGPSWRLLRWPNEFGNFELLDKSANASSGSVLDKKIEQERAEQARYYGDPGWNTVYPLFFDRVEADGGGIDATARWSDREVSDGEHVRALERLLGLSR